MNKRLVECVPNFSEGRDMKTVEKIVDCFRAKPGVKLLDYSTDPDHNRCVVTVVGEPQPLGQAMVEAIGRAVELIDRHKIDVSSMVCPAQPLSRLEEILSSPAVRARGKYIIHPFE